MTEKVLISDMTRAEVESALLLHQGLSKRLLTMIRETTNPEWKVAREADEIASHYTTLLARHIERASATDIERIVTERTRTRMDRVWDQMR